METIGKYEFEPADKLENFHGNIVVYILWEKHLAYMNPIAFPLPPEMPLGDFINGVVVPAYSAHPNASKVDFMTAEWTVDGHEVTLDPAKSLKDIGVGHKSVLRVKTPGFEGLVGAGSAA